VLPKPPWILLRSVLGPFKTGQLSSNDGLYRVVVILCYNPIVHKVIQAASTDPTVAGPRSSMTVIALKSSKQSPTGNTSTGIVRGCETDVVVSPSLASRTASTDPLQCNEGTRNGTRVGLELDMTLGLALGYKAGTWI
jgi:hypothetical protein